jgi:beta-aspartyl-peptidase (threonine type)
MWGNFMKYLRTIWCLTFLLVFCLSIQAAGQDCRKQEKFVLLVHGGADTGSLSKQKQLAKDKLIRKVLKQGAEKLKNGTSAIEVVEFAISVMEDSPSFNAGRGGIPNKAGFVELDASIMDGRDLNAGAVAALRGIKNPIIAARQVMEKSEHLLFVDRGAYDFAKDQGVETAPLEYFLVEQEKKPGKSGTVGAVVLDRCGNLAAGTSTGGYSTKTPGRVGDSPIIGAGTYADNKTCAVSATGWGEYFIRQAAAHDVSAQVEYLKIGIQEAAENTLAKIKKAGATGGLIVLDKEGRLAFPYTSNGMIRGYVNNSGELKTGIFKEMK